MREVQASSRGVTSTLFGGHGRALEVPKGERVTIVNTFGTQVVDMWSIVSGDGSEYLSLAHTHVHAARLSPRVGDELWSNRRRPIMKFEVDTSPGVHDTLLAACDRERYALLGYVGYHRNCTDNFQQACTEADVPYQTVPDPFNLFQNTPVGKDGRIGADAGQTKPGELVTFLALCDLHVVLSVCPMDLNPINGNKVSDIHVTVHKDQAVRLHASEPHTRPGRSHELARK